MTGILFIARLGSTRLSQKHLIEVEGKTFIEWLVERLHFEFSQEITEGTVRLIICTSVAEENKQFERLFAGTATTVFYGDDNNIPHRQMQCADAFGLDNIISVDGDDILCSAYAARVVLENLEAGKVYVKTKGLPLGMNVAGYKAAFLRQSLEKTDKDKLETGWGRIFDEGQSTTVELGNYADAAHLRFTLDYDNDAAFFRKIIEGLQDKALSVSDEELIAYVETEKIYEINQDLNEVYWNNFRENIKKEGN